MTNIVSKLEISKDILDSYKKKNTTIFHEKFGKGIIIDIVNNFITAKFENGLEKKFDLEYCILNNKISLDEKFAKSIESGATAKMENTIFQSKQENQFTQKENTCDYDIRAREIFYKTGIYEEDVVYSSGIREFLCDYFEQSIENVKGQMSSRWVVPWYQKVIVWVVEMERIKPNSQTDKWVNVYDGNEIIEIMPKGKTNFGHVHVRDYAKQHPYRIVVEKMKNKTMVVHGIYKFDEGRSVNDIEHYYVKI